MGGLLRSIAGWIGADDPGDRPGADHSEDRRVYNRTQAINNRSSLGWSAGDQFLKSDGRVVDVSLSGVQVEIEQLPAQAITSVVFKVDLPDQSHWVEASIAWRGDRETRQQPRLGLKFREFLPYQVYNLLSTRNPMVDRSLDRVASKREDRDASIVKLEPGSTAPESSCKDETHPNCVCNQDPRSRSTPPHQAIGACNFTTTRQRKHKPDRRVAGRYSTVANSAALGWWLGESFREVEGRFLDINHLGARLEIDGSLPPYIDQLWVRLITPRHTSWISVSLVRREMRPDSRLALGLRFVEFIEYDLFKHLLGYRMDHELPNNVSPEFDSRLWR